MSVEYPESLQREFWNQWNTRFRETYVNAVSQREAEVVLEWISAFAPPSPDIIEIGCGTGWLCERLVRVGRVVATDLANEVLVRAAARVPDARFVSGDFLALDLPRSSFDVAVSLEVIAHVPRADLFVARAAQLLRPGGLLMLATQNPFVVSRNQIEPAKPGQLRRWWTKRELRHLLEADFCIEQIRSVAPQGNKGILRVVNSTKINRFVDRILGSTRVRGLKERLGLGFSLMVLARRR